MRILPAFTALLVAATMLAGCSGKDTPTSTGGPVSKAPLPPDKGAISGLLIDDIYRPIPGGLVLLGDTGLTATADDVGQFSFSGLEPGSYIATASAAGHEAAPVNVDVKAGEYTDLEIQARRLFSQDGQIITTQYSVFIACSFEAVGTAGTGVQCGDLSGDSQRTGIDTDLRAQKRNVTYVVTEMKFNKKSDYAVVIGLVDSTNTFKTYYAEADVLGTDYVKITNEPGKVDTTPAEDAGNRNVNFTLDKVFQTAVFPHGAAYSTLHAVCPPGVPGVVSFTCLWGVGPNLAVKANLVQSVFLGKPKDPVEGYHVFSASP